MLTRLPNCRQVIGLESVVYAILTVRNSSDSSQLNVMAAASPSPNCRKNWPRMPGMKLSGMSTASSEKLAAVTALNTSEPPISTLRTNP